MLSFQGTGLVLPLRGGPWGTKYQPSLQSWLPLTWTLAAFPRFFSSWTLLQCVLVPVLSLQAAFAVCFPHPPFLQPEFLPGSFSDLLHRPQGFLFPALSLSCAEHGCFTGWASAAASRHAQDLFLPQSFMLALAHGIHLLWPFYWFCFPALLWCQKPTKHNPTELHSLHRTACFLQKLLESNIFDTRHKSLFL